MHGERAHNRAFICMCVIHAIPNNLFCIHPLTPLLSFTGRSEILYQDLERPSLLSLSYLSPPTIARLRSRVSALSRKSLCTCSLSVMAQHTSEPSSYLALEGIPISVPPSVALTSAVSSPLLVQETSQPLYLEQGQTQVDLELVTEATTVTTT